MFKADSIYGVSIMIGERLAELRKNHGMTQRQLTEKLSVSVTTISGYENDQNSPNDDIKIKIAKIFNISLHYLLGAIDEKLSLDRSNSLTLMKKIPFEVRERILEYSRFLSFIEK